MSCHSKIVDVKQTGLWEPTMKKRNLVLVICIVLFICCGRSSHSNRASWKEFPYLEDKEYRLTCQDSGKIIASILHADSTHSYEVFGGNGAGYGDYDQLNSAKAKAESLSKSHSWLPVMGSNYLSCP